MTGMTAWNNPKRKAVRNVTPQRVHFNAMPPVIDTVKQSIANPMAIIQISSSVISFSCLR